MHFLLYRSTSAYICRSSEPYISRQIYLQFSSLAMMNRGRNGRWYSGRGRGSSPSGNSAIPHYPVAADGHSLDDVSGGKDEYSHIRRQTSLQKAVGSVSKHFACPPMSHYSFEKDPLSSSKDRSSHSETLQQDINYSASNPTYGEEFPPLSAITSSSSKNRHFNKNRTLTERKSEERTGYISSSQLESSHMSNPMSQQDDKNITPTKRNSDESTGYISSSQIESSSMEDSMSQQDESSLPTCFGKKGKASHGKRPKHGPSYPEYPASIGNSYWSEGLSMIEPFDIFQSKSRKSVRLKPSWRAKNKENSISQQDESTLPTRFWKKGKASHYKRPKHGQSYPKNAVSIGSSDLFESLPLIEPFDICQSESRNYDRLKPSWRAKNRESMEGILRPGMVLLKSYITHIEQIEMVKKCQELGLGPGGFYQPIFRHGGKLRLKMMCLGLNWDHETRKYENRRPVDGSEPPGIPHEFGLLVERAIQDSHALIEKDPGVGNVEDILPRMSPNICIVNFYTTSGRLGLHQDRDESEESLRKGLPVVSFSVGDSAEFLYGDQRGVDKAEKVLLESGDVLIFGGESRHIFHGVSSIIPNSAPAALLEEAKIRPGRLNLTFRQL